MNKTIEALLRGYVLFKVNEKYFFRYDKAQAARELVRGSVEFKGLHFLKGWRMFFWSVELATPFVQVRYSDALAQCQKYYDAKGIGNDYQASSEL